MTMSHIAMVRSSARIAHQKASEAQRAQEAERFRKLVSNDDASQSSIISIGSSSDNFINQELSTTQESNYGRPGRRVSIAARPITSSLDSWASHSDIDDQVSGDFQYAFTINKLEQRWSNITANLNNVVSHLKQCSDQINDASKNCLDALETSIQLTCDKTDESIKTLHHLMAKCDELAMSLRITEDFREETRALRKSVDTLDGLFKSRPNKGGLAQGR